MQVPVFVLDMNREEGIKVIRSLHNFEVLKQKFMLQKCLNYAVKLLKYQLLFGENTKNTFNLAWWFLKCVLHM